MFKMASQDEMKKEMGASFLQTSFCGVAKIVGMEKVTGSNGSASEGIKFKVETEEGEGQFQIWFKKKDGSSNDYGIKQLTAIMGITKMNPEKFVTEISHDNFGNEIEKIKMDRAVECGLYLEAKSEEYNGKTRIKLEFRGAYYPQTKKTPAEQINGTEAKMFKSWSETVARKKNEAPAVKKQEEQINIEEEMDSFPF